jgi:hypothetical protein
MQLTERRHIYIYIYIHICNIFSAVVEGTTSVPNFLVPAVRSVYVLNTKQQIAS